MFAKKIASLMIVFILAMSFEAAPFAQASQHAQMRTDQSSVIQYSAQERAAAQNKFADPAVRAAAKPFPLPEPKGSAGVSTEKLGAPYQSAPGQPKPGAKAMAQALYGSAQPAPKGVVPDLSSSLTPYAKYYAFNRYIANWYTYEWMQYPYETVGKIYFSDGMYDYYCTATLIDYDIVATAAHCVYDTAYNFYYTAPIFYPAESGGVAPYGGWMPQSGAITPNWIAAKYYSLKVVKDDVALLSYPYTDGSGFNVSDYVGYLGYWKNLYPTQVVNTMGYPANLSSGDQFSYICTGQTFKKGSGVIGMGCDMEGGSSGGPWIVGFYPYYYLSGWAMSVVSGGYAGSGVFYGALFSDYNIGYLCGVTGWC